MLNVKTDAFVKRAITIHGVNYDYSKVMYTDRVTKVVIICSKCHTEFNQSPYIHLRGKGGCNKCAIERIKNSLRLDFEAFSKMVKKVHDDYYDLSLITNWERRSKQTIICKIHGKFDIRIGNFLSGSGCKFCARKRTADSQRITTIEFINEATAVHGKLYDYSKTEYTGAFDKLKVVCSIHGEFLQYPSNHIRGAGCKLCSIDRSRKSNETFLLQAVKVHNTRYSYDLTGYVNHDSDITVICPDHGEFKQRAKRHLNGRGCVKCAVESNTNTVDEFISNSNLIHNNRYDYSRTIYSRAMDKVTIICPQHGEFNQKANNHSNGQGCPKCVSNTSSYQLEIANYFNNNVILNDRKLLHPLEIDVYVPHHNFGIEFHGVYWHSFDRIETKDERYYHHNKATVAVNANIRLIQIFEHQWINKKSIILSMFDHIAKLSVRVNARSTSFTYIDSDLYKKFMDNNHLYGSRPSSMRCGLFFNNELISCIGFHVYSGNWEMTRFACLKGYTVVGGLSKLLSNFRKKHSGSITTFADRCYSSANAYLKVGFKHLSITPPNYFYVKGLKVLSRVNFQKHKLEGKLEIFDETLTEAQNMFNNGYRRIWDAGHHKLILE